MQDGASRNEENISVGGVKKENDRHSERGCRVKKEEELGEQLAKLKAGMNDGENKDGWIGLKDSLGSGKWRGHDVWATGHKKG